MPVTSLDGATGRPIFSMGNFREHFRMWVEAQPRCDDHAIGYRRILCGCPLARFLIKSTDRKWEALGNMFLLRMLERGPDEHASPKWARRFMGEIDRGILFDPINAKNTLEILAGIDHGPGSWEMCRIS